MASKRKTRTADKRRAATLEDALRAWDLRNEGCSLREIAKRMNLSGPQQARNLVERGFTAFYSPKVEQRRAESDERMHRLLAEFMPVATNKKKALDGRLAAADRVVKIDRELRQLHGLDAPTRTEYTGADGAPIVFTFAEAFPDEQLRALATADDPGDAAGAAGSGPG